LWLLAAVQGREGKGGGGFRRAVRGQRVLRQCRGEKGRVMAGLEEQGGSDGNDWREEEKMG